MNTMRFVNDLLPDVLDPRITDGRYLDITDSDLYCKDALRIILPEGCRVRFVYTALAPLPYCAYRREGAFVSVDCFAGDIRRIIDACDEYDFQWFLRAQTRTNQTSLQMADDTDTNDVFSVWVPDELRRLFLNRVKLEHCTAFEVQRTHWVDIHGSERNLKALEEYCRNNAYICQLGSAQEALLYARSEGLMSSRA